MITNISIRRFILPAIVVLTMGICMPARSAVVSDFTFIQISDEHVNSGKRTPETIRDLAALTSLELTPYHVNALPPSFVIETGDMTEFGPKNGAFELLDKFYSVTNMPRYRVLGNHDCTWRSLTPEMTKLYGAPYYSVDKFGCHFVILNSAGLQSPRPVISPEELEWLKMDLKRIGTDSPVFIALHHPLDCGEYSSAYEVERLLDVIRPYNVVLVLVGHGHQAIYSKSETLDMIQGGCAFGPGMPGYQVVSILNGVLRAAYKETGKPAADLAMLEKPLAPPTTQYPEITIQSPQERSSYNTSVSVQAKIALNQDQVKDAYAEIDGKTKIALSRRPDGSFGENIEVRSTAYGAHRAKICFTTQDGNTYHHSTTFYTDAPHPRALWHTYMGAASKSTPTISGDSVYVGTNDGRLHAYDTSTGSVKWEFKAGGAIAGQPLILNDRVYFGSEDGYLYCLSVSDKTLLWRFSADNPIYSTPVSDGKSIYFGCGNGAFFSLSAADGTVNWKNTNATYNIESQPFIAEDRVYYGCWDGYVYGLNTSDGSLVWKCMGQGSAETKIPTYYSAADCGPVVCNGKLFVADRNYRLSIIDLVTGKLEKYLDSVSATGLSTDKSSVYLRKTDGSLKKIDGTAKEIWSTSVSMDNIPAAPVESNGVIYVSSGRGLVSAISDLDGRILWQYQATPSSFVESSIGVSDKSVFVAGTDGMLTSLER